MATAVTGEVTLELRRGNDYSMLNTASPNLTYHPERLTMEQAEEAPSRPRTASVSSPCATWTSATRREKLEIYSRTGLLAARAEGGPELLGSDGDSS